MNATQRVVKITNVMKMENVIANVMLLVINVMIAVQNFGISQHAKVKVLGTFFCGFIAHHKM